MPKEQTQISQKDISPDPFEEINYDIEKMQEEHISKFENFPKIPQGFFQHYSDYGKTCDYAYDPYHFAASLSLVCSAIGRDVCMRSKNATIFPNVFVAMLGPTSISGKSTVCDRAADFYRNSVVNVSPIDPIDPAKIHLRKLYNLLVKKTTPQGLIQALCNTPNTLWYYDECSEFLKDSQTNWGSALSENLLTAYGCGPISYTMANSKSHQSRYYAENPHLTCLWNTTIANATQSLAAGNATSGFIHRFMWFICYRPNQTRINERKTSDDKMNDKKITDALLNVSKLLDDLSVKPGALSECLVMPKYNSAEKQKEGKVEAVIQCPPDPIIENWKLNCDRTHMKLDQEAYRVGTARLFGQAYKIALATTMMDLSIQDSLRCEEVFPIELKIPEIYSKFAVDVCDNYLRPRLDYVIGLAEYNEDKGVQEKILRFLNKEHGVASVSKILAKTHIKSKDLTEALETMNNTHIDSAGLIQVVLGKKDGKGRRPQIVLLLKDGQELDTDKYDKLTLSGV